MVRLFIILYIFQKVIFRTHVFLKVAKAHEKQLTLILEQY